MKSGHILEIVVSLMLVAFAAGCKSPGQTTTSTTTSPPTTTSTAPPTMATTTTSPPTTQTTTTGTVPPATITTVPPTSTTSASPAVIVINGGIFFPATLRIAKGATVQFQNQDHDTITIVSDYPFSIIIPIGGSIDIVLSKTGTFLYWDQLDPLDKGTIIVS